MSQSVRSVASFLRIIVLSFLLYLCSRVLRISIAPRRHTSIWVSALSKGALGYSSLGLGEVSEFLQPAKEKWSGDLNVSLSKYTLCKSSDCKHRKMPRLFSVNGASIFIS